MNDDAMSYPPLQVLKVARKNAQKELGKNDFRVVIDAFLSSTMKELNQLFLEHPWLKEIYSTVGEKIKRQDLSRSKKQHLFTQIIGGIAVSGIVREWGRKKVVCRIDSEAFETISKVEPQEDWMELLPAEPVLFDVCERGDIESPVPRFFIAMKHGDIVLFVNYWYDSEDESLGIGFECFSFSTIPRASYLYQSYALAASVFNDMVFPEKNNDETYVNMWDCSLDI